MILPVGVLAFSTIYVVSTVMQTGICCDGDWGLTAFCYFDHGQKVGY